MTRLHLIDCLVADGMLQYDQITMHADHTLFGLVEVRPVRIFQRLLH